MVRRCVEYPVGGGHGRRRRESAVDVLGRGHAAGRDAGQLHAQQRLRLPGRPVHAARGEHRGAGAVRGDCRAGPHRQCLRHCHCPGETVEAAAQQHQFAHCQFSGECR